jgi:hypothetical protein
MNIKSIVSIGLILSLAAIPANGGDADIKGLLKAVTFYASFDEAVRGDIGGGVLAFDTRFNHPTEKDKHVFEKGFDAKAFRIAKDKGVSCGALDAVDVLPRNGRIFVPVKGNLAFQKTGWGGAASMWCKTNPDTMLKTSFCDPIQITQKGANNGGLWFDFNDAKPRGLRLGAFPAVSAGVKGIGEADANAPMVRVPAVGWKADDWHHVVITWNNLDTGKDNAVAALYIDGKLIGQVKDRPIAMDWDEDRAGVYVAVNYIGLIDELGLFNRMLTASEVTALHAQPAILKGLKK